MQAFAPIIHGLGGHISIQHKKHTISWRFKKYVCVFVGLNMLLLSVGSNIFGM